MKRLAVSTLLVLLNSLYLYSFSGAGSGKESDPYQITNVQQLQEMDDDLDAHYILMNDIDAGDTKNWNYNEGFDPIGTGYTHASDPFTGSFDGQNYSINDLYMNRPSYGDIGLFSSVDYNEINNLIDPLIKHAYCKISNFTLNNITIIGGYGVGAVIGECKNAVIQNVTVSGHIEGYNGIGGLVGTNKGVINNCHTNVEILGNSYSGGLVGSNNGIILNSSSKGTVTAIEVQSLQSFSQIGGLAGDNSSYIINSYSSSNVEGEESIGGLVGRNTEGCIYTSYSIGEVTGLELVGGLAGENVDGFIEGCFWDTETSNQSVSAGGTGLTSISMKDINTYQDAGWNFDFIWSMNSDYPEISIDFSKQPTDTDNNGYININDAVAFRWMSESGYCFENNIELTSDIDLTESKNWNAGLGLMPVGSKILPFTGKVNGNDFTINQLYINRPNEKYIGLIGYMMHGVITNLVLENCEVYGLKYVGSISGESWFCSLSNIVLNGVISGDSYIGGMIGYCYFTGINNSTVDINVTAHSDLAGGIVAATGNGKIYNSSSYGEIKGKNNIAGIAGLSLSKIVNSFSFCNVTGQDFVAGIAGGQYENYCLIKNTFSKGNIEGNNFVGGIVGKNGGLVLSSYSTSKIIGNDSTGGIAGNNNGVIESCFWDIDSSGILKSDGGEGKYSGEMKQKNLYTDAGWNFDFIWKMDDNYPYIDIDMSYSLTDTDADGYLEISTLDNLRWLSECSMDIDNNLELSNDIDASDTKNWNQGRGFLPIALFFKEFNGNNYKISNLYINRPDQGVIGFFTEVIGKESKIQDLTIENCQATADSCFGVITASLYQGSIINAKVQGNINGRMIIGGIIGTNYMGYLKNCNAEVVIDGEDYLGGIISNNIQGTIDNARSNCTITCLYNKAGGIASVSYFSHVTNSHSIVDISGKQQTGGLIGVSSTDTITQCSSKGNISGEEQGGGLIGLCQYSFLNQVYSLCGIQGYIRIGGLIGQLNQSQLYDAFSRGDVSADHIVGGLIGVSTSGVIHNTYSTGLVVGNRNVGALIGDCFDQILASFWDTETSGLDSSDGGTGKTTAEMKTKSTFTDAGWDFDTIWSISPDINDGYPYFQWMENIVGVEDLPVSEYQLIKAYPNPANNFLHISCPLGLSETLNVRISDAAGNLVRDMDVVNINNELTLPVDGLSAGAYYMNIISGGEVYSVKFVVE